MKNYLYLIPVRAGSKRIPNKNILELCSKPLFTHSIEFAKEFTSNENIYVLTDSERAKTISRKLQVKVFERSFEFSKDDTSMLETILNFIEVEKISDDNNIVLLQPTSPFRSIKFFRKLKNIYDINDKASSAISVVRCIFHHPSKIGKLSNDNSLELIDIPKEDNIDNHKKTKYFVISGTYYITSVKNLKLNKSFVGNNPFALEEDLFHFCNIDTPDDFEKAKKLGQLRKCVDL